MQADSTRKTTQRQRFPRSAESTLHSTRREPPRSPDSWRNQGPFSAKPPRSRGVRTRAKPRRPSARQRKRNPQRYEQGGGENSHPASIRLLTSTAITASSPRLHPPARFQGGASPRPAPPSLQARPTQPRSLRCRTLHPFAEVLEGQRQHRGVAQARDGHDERFEQISEERILAIDAANTPDDAAVFPTCPA